MRAKIHGAENVARVLEVDQAPIGKTPRSCPATYVGFWDDIRKLFAGTPEAKMRGYGPSRFSFNVASGRCAECEGQGVKKNRDEFSARCVGHVRRLPRQTIYTRDAGRARYKDKSIGDVLAMSVDEAVEFFAAHRHIHHSLKLLQEVGLGYLTLGQQSPTLSGGEAQRIKLVTELAKAKGHEPDVTAKDLEHCTYWMNRPSDCIWRTWKNWFACCTAWSTPATRW